MKHSRIFIWQIIAALSIAPILLNAYLDELTGQTYIFIWSLFLIPIILMLVLYPKWKLIIATTLFFTIVKYTIETITGAINTQTDFVVSMMATLINWSIIFVVAYFRMENNKLIEQVKKLALIDPLTNLYNRRYFDLLLEKAIPHSERVNKPLLLMILDVDHFKRVNDTYGHICGDEALKHLSQVIKENVRSSDAYVRFGGEEFAVIMQDTDIDEGKIVAERLCSEVAKSTFKYAGTHIPLTISIGLTMYVGGDKEDLINHADKALYQAKQNGRNQLSVYECTAV
ncbi:GGDEF domain-containing protein [Alkalihalophilus marmarensis]|uniref:GGDEF domain-containing protein n=1 Tax=Alkalihalophilus marmarensis DSM 21297 TaxID=1188261 RepID=U6SJG4_9BACI|nr:GGDEF domain-containing protein [Alkalihalophilus marmarensis]ERN51829.1 hypothetical protein A33I_18635 [Alkalihalophilus marmarensis DSM 21297]